MPEQQPADHLTLERIQAETIDPSAERDPTGPGPDTGMPGPCRRAGRRACSTLRLAELEEAKGRLEHLAAGGELSLSLRPSGTPRGSAWMQGIGVAHRGTG